VGLPKERMYKDIPAPKSNPKSLKGSSSEQHRLVHLLQREKGPTTKE
jgi:hypothetical protein